MTKRLELIFMDAAGKTVRISLPNANEELQGERRAERDAADHYLKHLCTGWV